MALLRITAPTPAEYLMPAHWNRRLNGRKNQPNTLSMTRDSASFGA
jgi:hypothetical protein